jgi:multidrug efflux pump subunit AcrB
MNDRREATGQTGRLAKVFIRSKLTPLLIIMSLVIGALAIWITPKEDEPSIIATVADVFVAYPGRGASEVDERIARPVGSWIREIPTVKHVVSSVGDDGAMLVVEFQDGVPREKALTQLYDRLHANMGRLPPGIPAPLVKPRGIDDACALAVMLWSERDGSDALRRVAAEMAVELRRLPNVSRVDIIGGIPRSIQVDLDARRLAERGIEADRVVQAVQAANVRAPAGMISGPGGLVRVEAGAFLKSAADAEVLIVGTKGSGLVYLRDVARVRDGTAEPTDYVSRIGKDTNWVACPAVTLSVVKVHGSNVAEVARQAKTVLHKLAKNLLPDAIHVAITRDGGETAQNSVRMAGKHMLIATLVSVLLIALALGWREGVVAAIILPVTMIIIPIVYNLTGFSLNRISLAAIVFAIGLLIDNAIVIIESIHRHFRAGGASASSAAEAVRQVGPPTILATLMVICALLPTAFVTGMPGQYVRPLPIGASLGMLFSLAVALTVAPYLCCLLLRPGSSSVVPSSPLPGPAKRSRFMSSYLGILAWTMERPKRIRAVYAVSFIMLLTAVALIPARAAVVKLLSDKDNDELSVMIDLPPQTPLEISYARVAEVARKLREVPEVTACQIYVGASAPLTFVGIARHYDLRKAPYQAEIQLQLTPEARRSRTSHEIAQAVRSLVAPLLAEKDAVFTVAEIPAGPPTLAPLVAEVYGPDDDKRMVLARQVRGKFAVMPGVVDVDWTGRPGPPGIRYEIDHQSAAARGVIPAQAAGTVRTLVAGEAAAWAHFPREREPVPIIVRLARSQRSDPADISSLYFTSLTGGAPVPASDIGAVRPMQGSFPLMRKDLQPVVMVTGVVTGAGPFYSAFDLTERLRFLGGPDSQPVQMLWINRNPDTGRYAVRWDGEWAFQRDVYRDLGVAFAVVLFLIYAMLVAWYGSFLTPLVLMAPIPLVFIGVIPAHAIMGKPLDGVGILGVIALAGIVIRNSILLVDFARSRISSGTPIREAVLMACEIRLRPIVLTALAVILGEFVLYFDPVLQGIGLSLPAGAFVSTALTLGIVPVAYCQLATRFERKSAEDGTDTDVDSGDGIDD